MKKLVQYFQQGFCYDFFKLLNLEKYKKFTQNKMKFDSVHDDSIQYHNLDFSSSQ